MIARYIGDGVLAYFGYPRAQEDDAEQAVRAALALVDAVANVRTNVEAALQVRVGIATGTVVVSELLINETPAEQLSLVTLRTSPRVCKRWRSQGLCWSARARAGSLAGTSITAISDLGR